MKIGIDVSMLVYQGSGVANYTYNFVKALLRYAPQHEYRLFYSSFRKPRQFYQLDEFRRLGAKIFNYPLPPRILKLIWNTWHLLPVEWLIGKVDVFHSSDFLRSPLLSGTRGITTLHDLTWKIYPEFHTPEIVESHARKLEKTQQFKDMVIVDSISTQKDLHMYYPNIKKVKVLYPGIDPAFEKVPKEESKKVLSKYKIDSDNFLLYVGAIEPRKNLPSALKLFSELIKEKKFKHYDFVIVGRAGWKNEIVFNLIRELKLDGKVKFVGYVKDQELPATYSAADLTLYLSKYEGYGLPPLESLACETPVLALKNSSLVEILDPIYLVSENPVEMLSKLKILLTSKKKISLKVIPNWEEYVRSFLKVVEDIDE